MFNYITKSYDLTLKSNMFTQYKKKPGHMI